MSRHGAAVQRIAAQVRSFHDRKQPFRIYHGSTNSTRQSTRQSDQVVDTSKLSNVIRVNKEKKTALIEPNVRMDQLAQTTLALGLLPPVVMEFPAITAGGGFAGVAGESSSFKHGLFDSITLSIEIVLADGSIVRASRTERPDLFHGAAHTLGTLGVITLLEIELIDAKKYVELTYHPATSITAAIDLCQSFTKSTEDIDYVDGVIYSMDRAVIMTGRLTDTPSAGAKVRRFTRAQDPWFYLHVDSVTKEQSATVTEAVPIKDYLFRYDRGAFWVGTFAFDYFLTPFDWLSRFVLDRFLHTETMYRALHESGLDKQLIIQDFALPFSAGQDFIDFVNKTCRIFPLWLCPIKAPQQSTIYERPFSEDMLLNVGVWGPGPKELDDFVALHQGLQQKVSDLGGLKWPYSHAYYTEEEFWKIYDREAYEQLREKYNAQSLPTIFNKVRSDLKRPAPQQQDGVSWYMQIKNQVWSTWPLPGFYGIWRVLVKGDYLLERKSYYEQLKSFGLLFLPDPDVQE